MVAITRKFNDSCILVNKKFVNYVFLFSLACLRLWTTATTLAAVSDSLRSGDVLNFSSSICSPNQKFCMHFNPHGSFLKEHTYLIEYSGNTLVWIANRNKPIVNTSGLVLTLDHSGVMKIMNQGGETITLYSPAQPIRNSVATLLDSGNFILQEVNSNGSMKRLLWQSFDHPTHTLLPGMKLGVNHKTGHSWSLVSWLADNIPASGAFTLEWEPRGSQLLIKQRGTLYWTSGVLRNNKFEQIPKEAQLMFDYIIVSNDNEGYFSYTTRNNYSGWVLDVAGQMSDQGGGDLAKADNCYGYNTDGGCQRWEQPTCRHHGERFEFMSGYFDHETDSDSNTTSDLNSSLTASDCKATCWSNCECVGFVYSFENGTGCAFYNGKWKSVKLASGTPFGILVSSHSDKKVKKKWIWIGSSLATILLIISLCILCLKIKTQSVVLKGKRTKNEMLHLVTSDSYTSVIELENDEKKGHELRVFSYSSIMEATSNLSLENKLGEGGFGPVYKGKFSNGKEVAVKRLSRISRISGQGVIEFKNELTLISELQHMNLVQLLGCCVHGEEKMLIYEYMSNKSLDCFLFDSNNQSQKLDWKTRFSIIEGIAQGLIYLHKYSRLRVIHRDLKPETEANTKRIVGTYGYMSPEYAMEGIFSVKSDVYSFGVLVLEIVSGRRSNGFYHEDGPLNLVGYAWELWSDGLGQELIDQRISSSCINDQMLRCIHVALLCVEESANDRPTMPAVISMLTNESAELPLPKRPAFCTGRKVTDMPTLPIESKDNSINDLSISDIYVR